MHDTEFDAKMREMLQATGESLTPSENVQTTIMERMERGSKMKKTFHVRKFVAAAATLAIVVAGGAYAAGRVAFISGHSNSNEQLSYEDSVELAESINANAVLPETLGAGFNFDFGTTVNGATQDEEYNTVQSYTELSATYTDGSAQLYLSVSPGIEGILPENTSEPSKVVNGVGLNYTLVETLYVPVDYEPTQDELDRQEAGLLNIGYGTSEVERGSYEAVTFVKENTVYTLMGMNTSLGEDIMLELAASILA